ncbi:YkgJ family cysteine cluster protein [Saccharophagus degradans]|uniref:YkgJ family cysteine cluster protein n=1 Tax=Saccharophagus degradans TaxID=86304 RepID=UPI002477EE09|nr:YkgJ family cysteine cluster protein [Saccharophagus degradans]WGO99119.1 YkgJ family cysteine cluster protein [Saccharophagus degradans]
MPIWPESAQSWGIDATMVALILNSVQNMKDCNQCGKCCIKYGDGALSATANEIDMWELFQPHIFEYALNGEIWVDPATGKKLNRCPFLEASPPTTPTAPLKYTCSIYHDRPEDCRHYPTHIEEMIRDECEMIEPVDLTNTERAQTKLDIIMSDSRPAKK